MRDQLKLYLPLLLEMQNSYINGMKIIHFWKEMIFTMLGILLYTYYNLGGGVTGEIHYVDAGYNKVGIPDQKISIYV